MYNRVPAQLLIICLVGIARRMQGVTEEDYLSPPTVDDGRM
ncbi:MAG: hypothetical protein QNJ73_02445 [Gammaproteobacteria bacterium]|nr:hypothetical protein [Gammaproteobacteria bacterium]